MIFRPNWLAPTVSVWDTEFARYQAGMSVQTSAGQTACGPMPFGVALNKPNVAAHTLASFLSPDDPHSRPDKPRAFVTAAGLFLPPRFPDLGGFPGAAPFCQSAFHPLLFTGVTWSRCGRSKVLELAQVQPTWIRSRDACRRVCAFG